MQKCPICGAWFKNLRALHIHMARHKKERKKKNRNRRW